MKLTIYWTKKGRPYREKICSRFGIELYMTVNGETTADIQECDFQLIKEVEKRGFIEIRRK